jgi:PPM family protein phosphatase
MPLVLTAVARSHVGLVRTGNEDSGYAGQSLFVIADGMGGQVAGEVASRTVVAAMIGLDGSDLGPDPGATLQAAVAEANDRLRLAIDARPDLEGMGTTLTALAWNGSRLALVHIGDSRAYLLRDGTLTRLTHDQTLVQALIDEGRITEDEARTHPQRAVILQAMDGRPELDVELELLDPRPGDRYLVCSDGLTGYVSEAAVTEALGGPQAAAAVDGLIGLALEAGAPDNVTIVVVDAIDVDEAEIPDDPPDAATHRAGGILVGAVGETGAASTLAELPTNPASRAREGGRRSARTAPEPPAQRAGDEDDENAPDDDERDLRHPRRKWPWLVGLLAVLLIGGGLGARAWAQDQWYVGVDSGVVAIYSGVDISVGPISFSELQRRTTLETATLPEFAAEEVGGGIAAANEADAEAIVARLQAAALACLGAPDTAGCP